MMKVSLRRRAPLSLFVLVAALGACDAEDPVDAGRTDASSEDARIPLPDAGSRDAGDGDAGEPDGGPDGGPVVRPPMPA
ncbi:MAG: hypothetical protein AB8I08_35630, partial [Sandaracinaceae bacterium]